MTRSEAEQRALWLQQNDPAKETHRFIARRRAGDEWEVARVEVPERLRGGKLTPTLEAKPRPSPAEDPRTGNERRVPGLPGGLG